MKNLFEDDEESKGDTLTGTRLKTNESFLSSWSSVERKKELNRAKSLGLLDGLGDEDDSSSDESEDEDGEQLTAALDMDIMRTIQKIRSKDPEVYDSKKTFFPGTDEHSDEEDVDDKNSQEVAGKKKKKKLTVGDLLVRNALQGFDDENDDDSKRLIEPIKPVNHYDAEQLALKKAFLDSVQDAELAADEDGDAKNELESKSNSSSSLFRIKEAKTEVPLSLKTAWEKEKKRIEQSKKAILTSTDKKKKPTTSLEDDQGKEDQKKRENDNDPMNTFVANVPEDKDEKFLYDYIMNRGWASGDASIEMKYHDADHDDDQNETGSTKKRKNVSTLSSRKGSVEEIVEADDLEEDREDNFERSYNFRFEESGANTVQTHARGSQESSLRRSKDSRKRAREEKRQRKQELRKAKLAELARLKNLKRLELEHKLRQVAQVAGIDLGGGHAASEMMTDGDDKTGQRRKSKRKRESKKEKRKRMRQEAAAQAAANGNHDGVDESNMMMDETSTSSTMDSLVASLGLTVEDLEGDFDPEKFDKRMAACFNDEYYAEEDAEYDTERRVESSGDNNETIVNEHKSGHLTNGSQGESAGAASSLVESALNVLDYEDPLAETRFKYRDVDANDFGLSIEDILTTDDDLLRQYCSVKRFRTYREGGDFKVIGRSGKLQRMRKEMKKRQEERERQRLEKQREEKKELKGEKKKLKARKKKRLEYERKKAEEKARKIQERKEKKKKKKKQMKEKKTSTVEGTATATVTATSSADSGDQNETIGEVEGNKKVVDESLTQSSNAIAMEKQEIRRKRRDERERKKLKKGMSTSRFSAYGVTAPPKKKKKKEKKEKKKKKK
eukprot:g728.t1